MTILAGFSSSRQGSAPLNLAAQISRSTGDKIVAAAIVERPWPPRDDPVEDEYLSYVSVASLAVTRANGQHSCPMISTYRSLSINRPLSQQV